MTNCLVIVPARGGSKRLPGKNLKKLAGLSLMEWTARALKRSSQLCSAPCLLTTDDEAIAAEGRRLGWLVPWLRPDELASDTATSLDTVLHALDWWTHAHGAEPELVTLLQVTSPFRDPADLDAAIKRLATDPDINAVISTCDVHRTPASLFVAYGRLLQPLGSAGSTPVLSPNGSFYCIRTKALRTERTFFPQRLSAITSPKARSLDIDTAADFIMAEALAYGLIDGSAP